MSSSASTPDQQVHLSTRGPVSHSTLTHHVHEQANCSATLRTRTLTGQPVNDPRQSVCRLHSHANKHSNIASVATPLSKKPTIQQYDNTRGAWLTQEGCTITERKEGSHSGERLELLLLSTARLSPPVAVHQRVQTARIIARQPHFSRNLLFSSVTKVCCRVESSRVVESSRGREG